MKSYVERNYIFYKNFLFLLYVKQKRCFKQHLRKSLTITVWLTRAEQILCCNMGASINYLSTLSGIWVLPLPPPLRWQVFYISSWHLGDSTLLVNVVYGCPLFLQKFYRTTRKLSHMHFLHISSLLYLSLKFWVLFSPKKAMLLKSQEYEQLFCTIKGHRITISYFDQFLRLFLKILRHSSVKGNVAKVLLEHFLHVF